MAALRMFSDLERSAYRLDRLIGGMRWNIDNSGLMKGVRDASGAVRDAEVALNKAQKAVSSFAKTSEAEMAAFGRSSRTGLAAFQSAASGAFSTLGTDAERAMGRISAVDQTLFLRGPHAAATEMISVLSNLEQQSGVVGETMAGIGLSGGLKALIPDLRAAQSEFERTSSAVSKTETRIASLERTQMHMETRASLTPGGLPYLYGQPSYRTNILERRGLESQLADLRADKALASSLLAGQSTLVRDYISQVGPLASQGIGDAQQALLGTYAVQLNASQRAALSTANALSAVQQKQTEHLAEQLTLQKNAVSEAEKLQLTEEKNLRNRLLGAGVGIAGSLGLMALGGMGLRALGTDVSAARNLQDVTASMTIAASKGRTTPEQLSLQAMQIASRTQFSQTDVMKMMEVAATTGIMSRDVLANIMPTIANVAEIAYRTKGVPYEQTTEAAVSVAHQFLQYGARPGMSPTEAVAANRRFESLMGSLGQLLMVTSLTPNQLRSQLAYVAGPGQALGMSPQDVMSFVAFASNLGMTSGQGGGGRLRAFMSGLLPTLTRGVNIGNVVRSGLQEKGEGEFFPGGKPAPDMVRNALGIILRAREKLSPVEFMAAMNTAFGRAGSAVAIDMSNPAAIGRMDEIMQFFRQDPIGWANRQQEKLNQTLIGQQRTFETNMNNLHAVIGMNLLGPLTSGVTLFARLTESAAEFLALHPRFAMFTSQFLAVGSVMALVGGGLLGLRVIGGLIGGWGPALAGVRALLGGVGLFGGADAAAGGAVGLAALGPMGWVVLAAGALTLLLLNLDRVGQAINNLGKGFTNLGFTILTIGRFLRNQGLDLKLGDGFDALGTWLTTTIAQYHVLLALQDALNGKTDQAKADPLAKTRRDLAERGIFSFSNPAFNFGAVLGGDIARIFGAQAFSEQPPAAPTANSPYSSIGGDYNPFKGYNPFGGVPGATPTTTVPPGGAGYVSPHQRHGLQGQMGAAAIHVHVDARGSADPASVEAAARRGVAHGAAALHKAVAQHNLFGTVLPGDVDPSMRAVPV
jgi:hypothetical protein